MIESRNDEWVNFTTNVEFQPFVETKHVKTLDIKPNQKEDLIVPKLSLPLNHYCMIAEKVCPSFFIYSCHFIFFPHSIPYTRFSFPFSNHFEDSTIIPHLKLLPKKQYQHLANVYYYLSTLSFPLMQISILKALVRKRIAFIPLLIK